MGEKIIVGPISKGLKNDVKPFVVDNDSFPVLFNAYQWRSRIKRKRGTSFLGRLTRAGISVVGLSLNLNAGQDVNLIISLSLETNSQIIPGSINISGVTDGTTYTDPLGNGILVATGGTGTGGTINYATGVLHIIAGGGQNITGIFSYYPDLPVMGLEDFVLDANQYPGTLGFDTKYSYNISTASPYLIWDVSYYKNPGASASLPGYVPKTTWTPTTWNGKDYQQFWTVNYQGAMWATNGINIPFSVTNIGMQFKAITNVVIIAAGPPAIVTLSIANHGLVVGDFVFINEVVANTGINFQTGYVISTVLNVSVNVELPNATVAGAYSSGGIAQYLTNRSSTTVDSLRWYDGDPTDQNPSNPGFIEGKGWVNFAPPLSKEIFSIADLPEAQYYLVGARMIVPFKDRLLFIGPVVQTSSSTPNPIYLQDTVIYSQNGTPYYTASFTGDASLATTIFNPILVPVNQTATAPAYWEDQTGFGGFISAGIDQPIITSTSVEDVLILGFSTLQTRLVYSGNDIVPFNFFIINSELGSGSTFSAINMDKGSLTRGNRGYIATSQVGAQRIDLDIPDQVFETRLKDNGAERVCSQRDFISEWVYFTYPVNDDSVDFKFPTQTLQYNYRDNSWAIFGESYTTYGTFRKQTGFTWATIGNTYSSWADWNEPWNAGVSTLLQQEVIAGNQQGFVIIRDSGTNESKSLYIQSFSTSTITSPNHSLMEGDYIIITGVIGTIGQQVNGKIFSVASVLTANTFVLNPPLTSGTYLGGGLITKMYVPFIQSKQFPTSWGMARKTRLGVQQYLLSGTAKSQIQLLIYLSQDADNAYNSGNIVPQNNVQNNSLIFSSVLYTCPESTNLGLTPFNTNLNLITAIFQSQIWHRINTSLIGDTVQVGFTLSDAQMRSLDTSGVIKTITGITQASPAVITVDNSLNALNSGQLIKISGVVGMTQLNFNSVTNNNYNILSANSTTITIQVDSTGFGAYVSGGSLVPVSPLNQFAEIELHGFILDCTPSSLLA